MASKIKFTDIWINKLSVPSTGQKHYGDAACSGLSLRHTKNDVKSFSFTYKVYGQMNRITLGRYPDIGLKQARAKADEYRRIVASGEDPRRQHTNKKEAEKLTVTNMIDIFIDKYAKQKNSSWQQAQSNLRLYLAPNLGRYPISKVKRSDIHAILDDLIKQGKGTAANRALAHMRKFFGWLVEHDYLENSPADHIKQKYEERPRSRVLSDDELKAIWTSSAKLNPSYRDWVRLLLLCGQRATETARIRRAQIQDGCWHLEGSDTKNKSATTIPLSNQAQQIVDELLTRDGNFLLPARGNGDKPINGFSKIKQKMDELSGVSDWRWHDLRAAVATNLAKLGYDRAMIKRILNHKDTSVTAIYERYYYLKEKRAALQCWADELERICSK